MLRWWTGIGAAAVLAAMIGCGGGTQTVKTVPVKGKVTLDGKPVEGATVQFAPEDTGGRAALGLTKSDGSFELTTVGGGPGVVPGKYKVAITKRVGAGAAEKPASQEEAMKKIQEQMAKGGGAAFIKAPPKIQDELPPKYGNTQTSGFSAEVKPTGDNTFTFDMTSGGAAAPAGQN